MSAARSGWRRAANARPARSATSLALRVAIAHAALFSRWVRNALIVSASRSSKSARPAAPAGLGQVGEQQPEAVTVGGTVCGLAWRWPIRRWGEVLPQLSTWLGQWRRAAAVAAAHHLEISGHCAPHLHVHAAAAVPNLRHLEWFHDHVRIEDLFFDGTLDPTGGALQPDPVAPGNGLTVRDDVVRRYQVGDTVRCESAAASVPRN